MGVTPVPASRYAISRRLVLILCWVIPGSNCMELNFLLYLLCLCLSICVLYHVRIGLRNVGIGYLNHFQFVESRQSGMWRVGFLLVTECHLNGSGFCGEGRHVLFAARGLKV